MQQCTGDFWMTDPINILCGVDFIPLPSMTLEEQLNAITRLIVLVSLLVLPISCKNALVLLVVGIASIITLFYMKIKMRRQDKMEPYESNIPSQSRGRSGVEYFQPAIKHRNKPIVEYFTPQCSTTTALCTKNASNPARVQSEYTELEFGPGFKSWNQQLVGKPAARTTVPPVMVPPPASDQWAESSFVVRAGINSQTNEDLGRSGYIIQSDTAKCGDHCGEAALCGADIAKQLVESQYTPASDLVEGYHKEGHGGTQLLPITPVDRAGQNVSVLVQDSNIPKPNRGVYNIPYHSEENCGEGVRPISRVWEITNDNYPGSVLKSDGYFPEQIPKNNLPSNVAFGKCQKTPEMKSYNKQLYTSMLQPGVYTRNEIEEPISSNIGISFTQQFEPVTCEKNCDGVTFIGHDPNVREVPYIKSEQVLPYDRETHLADITDPRFTGYGTSYRSYVEPVTGQPRFYYDDVDAYKRPSYLTKSNVDFLPSSLSTQAIPSSEYFDKQNKHSRAIANEAFMNNTVSFRTDLQERLMRKANANMAEKRRFPKHTSSFNRGGMSGRH